MTTDTPVRPNNSLGGYTEEEACVHRKLMEAGLLKEVKPRHLTSQMDRPLATIEGKPLSETIIEERR